ncbi:CocE/NonD family hydrolase, partial [Kibdelosporangium lantanae]
MLRAERRLAGALARLPLRGTVSGAPWYDEWVGHPDVTDPYWEPFRVTEALRRTTVPTLLIGGWHDYFLNQTLAQYAALRSRDVNVAMTIGPWTHLTVDNRVSLPEAVSWLDAHAAGRGSPDRKSPVRVYVSGAGQWQGHQHWPPEGLRPRKLYLGTDLTSTTGATFRYDPANPTPSVGGRVMALSGGAKDNRGLESRPDVLVFTTAPLTSAVEIHGAPMVELYVASDNADADLFVRICDVAPDGRSVNPVVGGRSV